MEHFLHVSRIKTTLIVDCILDARRLLSAAVFTVSFPFLRGRRVEGYMIYTYIGVSVCFMVRSSKLPAAS